MSNEPSPSFRPRARTKRILTGRAVLPVSVRFRSSAQREALERAAAKAKVSLSYYLLESALMVAAEEGFTPQEPAGWRPKLRAPIL